MESHLQVHFVRMERVGGQHALVKGSWNAKVPSLGPFCLCSSHGLKEAILPKPPGGGS